MRFFPNSPWMDSNYPIRKHSHGFDYSNKPILYCCHHCYCCHVDWQQYILQMFFLQIMQAQKIFKQKLNEEGNYCIAEIITLVGLKYSSCTKVATYSLIVP